MEIMLANTVDHDQTPHNIASDLDLPCLPRTLLRVSRGENGLTQAKGATELAMKMLITMLSLRSSSILVCAVCSDQTASLLTFLTVNMHEKEKKKTFHISVIIMKKMTDKS